MPGFATVTGSDDLAELCVRYFVFAHFKERSDDSTYHVTQEAVGGDDEVSFGVVDLYPFRFANVADHGLDIRMGSAERCEVLLAEQVLRGAVHRIEIESCRYAGMVNIQERVFARSDAVVIGSFRGVKACVRIVGDAAQVGDYFRDL